MFCSPESALSFIFQRAHFQHRTSLIEHNAQKLLIVMTTACFAYPSLHYRSSYSVYTHYKFVVKCAFIFLRRVAPSKSALLFIFHYLQVLHMTRFWQYLHKNYSVSSHLSISLILHHLLTLSPQEELVGESYTKLPYVI